MDEKDVLITGGLWFDEIVVVSDSGSHEAIVNTAVFLGRKDMAADRQIIGVAVNEFEREHCEPFMIAQRDSFTSVAGFPAVR